MDTSRAHIIRLLLTCIVPAVMTLNAVLQFYNARVNHTSAWKGGSFGMFSCLDYPHHRTIRCALQTTDGEVTARLGTDVRRTVKHLVTHPSESSMTPVARELMGMRWRVPAGPAPEGKEFVALLTSRQAPDDPALRDLEITGIEFSVMTVTFDNNTHEGYLRRVNAIRIEE